MNKLINDEKHYVTLNNYLKDIHEIFGKNDPIIFITKTEEKICQEAVEVINEYNRLAVKAIRSKESKAPS